MPLPVLQNGEKMFNILYSLLETSAETSANQGGFAGFIARYGLLIVIAVLFIGMIWFSSRQRKKQEKEMNDKLSSLKIGDKIETIGRIYGTIVSVNEEENTIIVLTGDEDHPGYVKLDKMAVYRTIVDYPEQPAAETTESTATAAAETTETAEPAAENVFEETAAKTAEPADGAEENKSGNSEN